MRFLFRDVLVAWPAWRCSLAWDHRGGVLVCKRSRREGRRSYLVPAKSQKGLSSPLLNSHHKTQVAPLVEEISVDIDTVRLRQILGDQLFDSRKVRRLFLISVADISQVFGSLVFGFFLPGLALSITRLGTAHREASLSAGRTWDESSVGSHWKCELCPMSLRCLVKF